MTEKQQTTLWVGAFRYHLGRSTYAVGDFCELLISKWKELPESARTIILRELKVEFAHDDMARAKGSDFKPLGDDCDRAQWLTVMQAIEQTESAKNEPSPR